MGVDTLGSNRGSLMIDAIWHCYVFQGRDCAVGAGLMMHLQICRIVSKAMDGNGYSSPSSTSNNIGVVEKKMQLPSTLRGMMELTTQYSTHSSERLCVITLEHTINLNTLHSLMCCRHPIKTVNIEEGYKLKLIYQACNLCDRCRPNLFRSDVNNQNMSKNDL